METEVLERILDYIDTHITEKISLPELYTGNRAARGHECAIRSRSGDRNFVSTGSGGV